MPFTYAIPDMHGRYDLWEKAKRQIADHIVANGVAKSTTIVLGDWIDRGPNSKEITEDLMNMSRTATGNHRFIVLKGNHEDMWAMAVRNFAYMNHYLGGFGGFATLKSYGIDYKLQLYKEDMKPMATAVHWVDSLPVKYEDKYRIYVHAGLSPHPVERQKNETLMWWRYNDSDEGIHSCGKHVVHGHEQNALGPLYKKGRTALDCHAYHTGRLAIGVFDDDIAGGPVETLWAVA